jgi:DNA-binding beta-propeller fold protein YncE
MKLLTVTFRNISARRVDGTDVPLLDTPFVLHGDEWVGIQKKLTTAKLPPGVYQGLVLQLDSPTLMTNEGRTALLVSEEPVVVEEEFTISPDRSLALFLSMVPDRITKGTRFTPAFSLRKPRPALPALKGFTSNAGAGTLTVFEKKTPAVTATISLGRLPGELALDQNRRRVYAALGGEDAIAVIDLVNEVVQARIKLRPGDEPREIALSPDGRTLVSANPGSHSVSVVDPLSFFERERILLSSKPSSVFFDRSNDRAFVVHESTGTLMVIDTRQPRILASAQIEESPLRGAVSADGRELYLITAYSSDLLVVDTATLAVIGRKFVGPGALCIQVDENDGLIYVGSQSGEVVVLEPDLDLPIDSLATSGPVSYLAIDREENSLFTVIAGGMRIEKYDLVSKKFNGAIEVDEGAYAVSVMGEE